MAFLLKATQKRRNALALKTLIAALAAYLWVWNVALIVQYLFF